MATRDHTLDGKLLAAARAEFLEHGFRDASIHRIAKEAGATTGAIYTRYRNKDELFSALVAETIDDARTAMASVALDYAGFTAEEGADAFVATCRREQDVLCGVLLNHYEECVLMLCRSEGTTVDRRVRAAFDVKAEGTLDFMRRVATEGRQPDEGAVRALVMSHLHMYREVLSWGYAPERTAECLRTANRYLFSAWRQLFVDLTG